MTTPADVTTTEQGPVALPDPKPDPKPERPGQARRIGRGLWRAFKWLVALTLIAGIAAAIYFGWPEVNRRFIQPIADNTAELNTLDGRLEDTRTQLAELEDRVDASIAAQGGMPERLANAETTLSELSETLDDVAADTRALDRLVADHTSRLDAIETAQAALIADQTASDAETIRQFGLLRSMELLSRARLFLYQSNFGLAEQDVQVARDLLAEIAADYPETDAALMTEVIFRLDRTLDQLPDRPVAAADDLDIAWSVLLGDTEPPGASGADNADT